MTLPSSSFANGRKRNLMASLMLSVGVPMMLGGDELSPWPGRKQ